MASSTANSISKSSNQEDGLTETPKNEASVDALIATIENLKKELKKAEKKTEENAKQHRRDLAFAKKSNPEATTATEERYQKMLDDTEKEREALREENKKLKKELALVYKRGPKWAQSAVVQMKQEAVLWKNEAQNASQELNSLRNINVTETETFNFEDHLQKAVPPQCQFTFTASQQDSQSTAPKTTKTASAIPVIPPSTALSVSSEHATVKETQPVLPVPVPGSTVTADSGPRDIGALKHLSLDK